MNIKAKSKKINNNMKKEELIGKKVRGFRFEKNVNSVWYMASQMDKYVGKEGIIGEYDPKFDSYIVKFEDGMSYNYPAERIEHHLVVEEPAIEIKEGDYIRGFETNPKGFEFANKYIGLIAKVTNIGRHSIRVKFTDNEGVWYPKDQAIEHLCNDDMEEFEKGLEQGKVDNEDIVNKTLKEVRHKADNGVNITFDSKSSNDLKLESLEKEKLTYSEAAKKEERFFNANLTKDARLDKKNDIVEEPDEETKQKLERFEKVLENGIANSKLNESCIDYGKIEHDPLDDLPMICDGVLMEVSSDNVDWYERFVFAKSGKCFLAHPDANKHKNIIYGITPTLWEYARPISKTKITRKEFESKFEIID